MGITNRQRLQGLAVLLALAAIVTLPRAIVAQPAADAVKHYRQAEAYFKAGAFAEAAEEYKKSYGFEPRAALLFNMALAYENAGNAQAAVDGYVAYLAADPNGVKAVEARARKTALEKPLEEARAREETIALHRSRAAELTFAGDHIGAVAELRDLYELTSEAPILYQIGVAYENAGEKELARAEYARYIDSGDTALASDAAARMKALESPDQVKPPDQRLPDQTPTPTPTPPAKRSFPALPVIASGLTFAALGTGVFFGLASNSLKSELEGEFESRDPPLDNSDSRFRSGRNSAWAANGFLAVSLVGAGASAYLWWRFLRGSGSSEGEPSAYVAPSVSGMVVGGSF